MSNFSTWLNNEMVRKDITQQAIADMLGVSNSSVSNWQNAKNLPDAMTLKRIAAVFGVDAVWLFRLVGYLPEAGSVANGMVDETALERNELLSLFKKLPEHEQDDILDFLRIKARRSQKKDDTG